MVLVAGVEKEEQGEHQRKSRGNFLDIPCLSDVSLMERFYVVFRWKVEWHKLS